MAEKDPSTPAGGNRGGGPGRQSSGASGQRRNSNSNPRSNSRPSTRTNDAVGGTPVSSPAATGGANLVGSGRRPSGASGRTSAGSADKPGSAAGTPTTGVQRRASRGGVGGGPTSVGRRGSETAAPAPASFGSPSSGEDRLRQMIGELKAIPASSSNSSNLSSMAANTSTGGDSAATSTSGVDSPGGRASPSASKAAKLGGAGAAARKAGKDTGGGMKSTLNPNAGGFQPGALSVISDVDAEVLITPGPEQTNFTADQLGPPFQQGRTAGQSGPFELSDEMTGFGALNMAQQQMARGFTFPQSLNGSSLGLQQPAGTTQPNFFGQGPQGLSDLQASIQAQALQVAQMQAALAASQQQQQQQATQVPPRFSQSMAPAAGFDALAAMASMGGFGGMSGFGMPNPMLSPMSETFQIQQQLQLLQQQQEALMNRFGDLQAQQQVAQGTASVPQQSSPQLGQTPQQPQSSPDQATTSPLARVGGGAHRRGQSVASGTMGQFGIGGGVSTLGQNGGLGSAHSTPKGHGRRHSVQVGNKAVNISSPPMPGAGGMAGLGGVAQNTGIQQFTGANESDIYTTGTTPAGSAPTAPVRGHRRGPSMGSISGIGGFQMDFGGGSVDLGQAQLQLQQLAQFRAASGHARVPSFGFQNPMNLGPGQAGFGPGNAQQMRKSLFAPYLPQASIPPLLAAGKLVIGTLRVNKRNRSDAYVATDSLDSDIYICGSKDRNRALEGDLVAVELLDVDEVWGTKKEKEEKKRKKEENQAFDPRAQQNLRREDKKRDDVEVEGQGLALFEEEEVNDEQRPSFAGHIVAVVERMPGQLFSGTLGLLRPSSAATKEKQEAERREREGVDLRANQREEQKPKIVWHRPTDKRVPLIAIPVDQAPPDFLADPSKYANTLFIAGIKRWPITSLHPFGTLVEELGPIGDIEVETNALLKDCNFSAEDFSENVVRCLPPVPWQIPEREYEVRRDFRDQGVFTIDPETAKDLDDALHVVKNDDGTFEVGVHIADVSHFVKQNTALDREARKRATTVYLVQRAVPMLPPTLCEQLCSLNPGQDKLTFSVVFKLTSDAKIIETWYGKSVIRSVAKLAYSDAQEVIDGKRLPHVPLHKDDLTPEDIERDILLLNGLARHLRGRRFDDGCLRIDNVKLSFALDEDGLPDDCKVYERREANELIEEFMLLANISVAQRIALGLPDQSLLRRHEPPIDRRLEGFVKRAKQLGFDIDTSSAGALMRSFNQIGESGKTSHFVMQLLATKSMLRAKYFCSGMIDIVKWQHYALNVPIYTHFTSPIRRYADVMVHRQLEAVLLSSVDVKFGFDTEAVSKIAQQCNVKKEAAKLAQEQSQHLYLCMLISELTRKYGPVVRPANVIGVLDEAFDVAVPDFGIEKRVHVDQMPIDNHVHDEHANSLKLYWKKGVDVVSYLSEHSNDAHLHSVRHHAERHARLMEASSQSVQAESALFDDDDSDDDVVTKPSKAANGAAASDKEQKSQQKMKSFRREAPVFEGVEAIEAGPGVTHHVQTVRELQAVPVIVTADTTKSPPVIKIFAVNPFASAQ